MQLLPISLRKKIPPIYGQQAIRDPMVWAVFFNPVGAGTWFVTEFDPVSRMCFGFVSIHGDHDDELGYFSLAELEDIDIFVVGLSYPFGIERDLHFSPKTLSAALAERNIYSFTPV